MRSLIFNRTRTAAAHDPAPSRLGYRLQRLMLTPGFRGLVRIGVPLALIGAIAGSWYSQPQNREQLAASIADVQQSFQERPQFMVLGARVSGGNAALTAEVEALLPATFPISSFNMDLDRMRAQIEALDAVKSATVRVGQSGLLEVALAPRVPVAVWRDGTALRLIDADGVVSGGIAARAERLDLPLIAGDGAEDMIAEALALFAASGSLIERVRGLVRMSERRWDLVLVRDQRILLPSEGAVRALDRVLALDAAQDLLDRDISVIDMRNAERPTLRLNASAVAALRQIPTTSNTSDGAGN